MWLRNRAIEAGGHLRSRPMGLEGLEPPTVTKRNSNELRDGEDPRGAESGAVDTETNPIDSDLATVIDGWPSLPKPVKAGIVAMVRAAVE